MVDWATIGASVVLSVIGSVFLTEYRLRRERSVEEVAELEDWYDDSVGLAAEARRNWQRLFDTPQKPESNFTELKNEMSLLEGQISRHASAGEQLGADSETINALDQLAAECRRAGKHQIHMNSLPEFEEFRDNILAKVEEVEEAIETR